MGGNGHRDIDHDIPPMGIELSQNVLMWRMIRMAAILFVYHLSGVGLLVLQAQTFQSYLFS